MEVMSLLDVRIRMIEARALYGPERDQHQRHSSDRRFRRTMGMICAFNRLTPALAKRAAYGILRAAFEACL
jgi:hypothetical protein